jgi:DNA-binding GntR family transcriptional regulator
VVARAGTVVVVAEQAPIRRKPQNASWKAVAAALREEIIAGRLAGQMPPMREQAARFATGYATIQRAYADLASQGLVVIEPRHAVYAVPPERFDTGQWLIELNESIDRLTRLRDRVAAQLAADAERPPPTT